MAFQGSGTGDIELRAVGPGSYTLTLKVPSNPAGVVFPEMPWTDTEQNLNRTCQHPVLTWVLDPETLSAPSSYPPLRSPSLNSSSHHDTACSAESAGTWLTSNQHLDESQHWGSLGAAPFYGDVSVFSDLAPGQSGAPWQAGLFPGTGQSGPVCDLTWRLSLVFNLCPFSVPNSRTRQCWIN